MTEEFARSDTDPGPGGRAVNTRVLDNPGTAEQQGGVIVEDFGEFAGQAVDVGLKSDRRRGATLGGPAQRRRARLRRQSPTQSLVTATASLTRHERSCVTRSRSRPHPR